MTNEEEDRIAEAIRVGERRYAHEASTPSERWCIAEAAYAAGAAAEREEMIAWFKNRPGISWRATVQDIEECIRARSTTTKPEGE